MPNIYLDYAAATPLDKRVLAAMTPYLTDNFYNPSGITRESDGVRKAIDATRSSVANILGVKSAEIIFTAGGTEANNLAIRGVMEQYPGSNLIISAIEHESVIAPAFLYDSKLAPVSSEGIIDIDRLVELVDNKTVLVSVIYASNEVGSIQPLKELSDRLEAVRSRRERQGNKLPLYLHSDAAQAGNYLSLHADKLGVDMLSLNGGKIYGPKQSGVLYVKSSVRLKPLILGGGQESALRSGTENVAGIIGFGEALSIAQNNRLSESARLKSLQSLFFDLMREQLPAATINGSLKHRLPSNVHLTIPGIDNERTVMELDEKGIIAASGSACSAASQEPSHVLMAMGLSKAEIRSSLRFSMGRSTSAASIRAVVSALLSLV
jgi:cysteine desulfurase